MSVSHSSYQCLPALTHTNPKLKVDQEWHHAADDNGGACKTTGKHRSYSCDPGAILVCTLYLVQTALCDHLRPPVEKGPAHRSRRRQPPASPRFPSHSAEMFSNFGSTVSLWHARPPLLGIRNRAGMNNSQPDTLRNSHLFRETFSP